MVQVQGLLQRYQCEVLGDLYILSSKFAFWIVRSVRLLDPLDSPSSVGLILVSKSCAKAEPVHVGVSEQSI